MNRLTRLITGAAVVALALTGCGGTSQQTGSPASSGGVTTIKVGASPVPHAEILKYINDTQAAAAGISIQVVEFNDYVQPNSALADKSIDANYFQHKPYLDAQIQQNGYQFTSLTPVHLEPLGVYSKKVTSLGNLATGATIAVPNDPSNEARALKLLADNGLITLKDPTNLQATPIDIASNPKNLKFSELEAAQLPRSLPDVDAAVINGNYALEAKLSPAKDAIAVEKAQGNPYANLLVVRTADKDKPALKTLAQLLCSKQTQDWIASTYNGAVIPAC